MFGFMLGLVAMYLGVGAYVYVIGKPLNMWLAADKAVTFKALLGWPETIRRVMREGVNKPATT